jgi:hypothetical protein
MGNYINRSYETSRTLREEFREEMGHDCFAYRQEYAGAARAQDGFCDEYVEWLEARLAVAAEKNRDGLIAFLKEKLSWNDPAILEPSNGEIVYIGDKVDNLKQYIETACEKYGTNADVSESPECQNTADVKIFSIIIKG